MRVAMISAEALVAPSKRHLIEIALAYSKIATIKITFSVEIHSYFSCAGYRHAIKKILLILHWNSSHDILIRKIAEGLSHFNYLGCWIAWDCQRVCEYLQMCVTIITFFLIFLLH
jgi:hypothetical protein